MKRIIRGIQPVLLGAMVSALVFVSALSAPAVARPVPPAPSTTSDSAVVSNTLCSRSQLATGQVTISVTNNGRKTAIYLLKLGSTMQGSLNVPAGKTASTAFSDLSAGAYGYVVTSKSSGAVIKQGIVPVKLCAYETAVVQPSATFSCSAATPSITLSIPNSEEAPGVPYFIDGIQVQGGQYVLADRYRTVVTAGEQGSTTGISATGARTQASSSSSTAAIVPAQAQWVYDYGPDACA